MKDVLIIGSGPAGYTAAIYAARANLSTLVVEGNQPGGQLTITTDVENFPGFPEGIQGPELMDQMKAQAERFGAECIYGYVGEVDVSSRPFKVKVDDEWVEAKSIVIATGASARYLGLPSEELLKGRGVSACATCDGFFYRDQDIAVIGGGDSAMEEATFLTRFAKKVYVVHRRDELRASAIMQKRAKDNPKIEFVWNKNVKEVLANDEGMVGGIRLVDTKTGEESTLEVTGMFLAIGHTPNTGFLKDILELDDEGYVVPVEGTKTTVEGMFAAGDVADKKYKQAITAAGMGCQAALEVEHYLANLE